MSTYRLRILPPGSGVPSQVESKTIDINFKSILIGDSNIPLEDVNGVLSIGGFRLQLVGGVSANEAITVEQLNTALLNIGEAILDSLTASDGLIRVGDDFRIADSGVTESKLTTDAVTSTKILDGSIIESKLATDAVTNTKIADDSITESKLTTDAVTSTKILDGSIIESKLATDSVTNTKILDGSIIESKLATDAVTSTKILDGSIIESKLATDSVTSTKILDGSIIESKLATDSVTSTKILDGSIIESKLATGSVTRHALNSNVVGDGLQQGSAGELAVKPRNSWDEEYIAHSISVTPSGVGVLVDNVTIAPEVNTGRLGLIEGSVSEEFIADNSVTSDKLRTEAVTADKLSLDLQERFGASGSTGIEPYSSTTIIQEQDSYPRALSRLDSAVSSISASSSALIKTYKNSTGANIPPMSVVAFEPDGSISLADLQQPGSQREIAGITVSEILDGSFGDVFKIGNIPGALSGLPTVHGQKVFLGSTPGSFSLTPPDPSLFSIVVLGLAEVENGAEPTTPASSLYLNPHLIIGKEFVVEHITLQSTHLQNKSIQLSKNPVSDVTLDIIGGVSQMVGDDFMTIGDILSWNGTALDGILEEGDTLRIGYNYLRLG